MRISKVEINSLECVYCVHSESQSGNQRSQESVHREAQSRNQLSQVSMRIVYIENLKVEISSVSVK